MTTTEELRALVSEARDAIFPEEKKKRDLEESKNKMKYILDSLVSEELKRKGLPAEPKGAPVQQELDWSVNTYPYPWADPLGDPHPSAKDMLKRLGIS